MTSTPATCRRPSSLPVAGRLIAAGVLVVLTGCQMAGARHTLSHPPNPQARPVAQVLPDGTVIPLTSPAEPIQQTSAVIPLENVPAEAACACSVPTSCNCRRDYDLDDDLERFGAMIKGDTQALANWDNALILGIAAGGAIALRQDADDEVRQRIARHPDRWGKGSEVLGELGDLPVQIPTILGVYGYGVWSQDARMQSFGESLISAYTINGVGTVLLKAAVNTDRPSDDWNNGQFGFPSFHTSSSFTLAAVADEYYGPAAGIPAYAFAGLVGWSRLDEQDHDLSDVVFGAALGYVIGKSVARHHLTGDGRVQLLPYVHPAEGTTGVMLETRF